MPVFSGPKLYLWRQGQKEKQNQWMRSRYDPKKRELMDGFSIKNSEGRGFTLTLVEKFYINGSDF